MLDFGLMMLTVFIIILTLIFYAGIFLDFIKPSILQVHLLGIHLTLFGVIILLAFEGARGFGFTFGLIGLFIGIFGSFRNPGMTKDQ
ncbi:hypothetical protein SAMN05216378_1712 [Paenibacillus catalpae]|uniref:Uncharacterized protein n=1 Tax=Paenibacillus catalpae TaxID=1045775 RepID=A0A1I1VNU1_9BACL|nr:hypothetical protein [Paenibacillus catalpae]SFD84686.1 hypothetical protein SAMN05216378_1712 [Paenibacillus catalpae]